MSQKAESAEDGFLPRMDSYSTNNLLVYSALADNAWECDEEAMLQDFGEDGVAANSLSHLESSKDRQLTSHKSSTAECRTGDVGITTSRRAV